MISPKTKSHFENGLTLEPSNFEGSRVIHFHPTLQCNLKCLHCYSSSAPEERIKVAPEDIAAFLEYAKAYNFDTLSVSGGEPFMYRHLGEVLECSKQLGWRNMVASNGTLLKSKRNQSILPLIDVIAISIDGNETLHDRIRNQKGAFQKTMEGIKILQATRKNFGLIHTVTPESFELLPWLANEAQELGAQLLQLHPLELYGRASENFKDGTISQELLQKVFILGHIFKAKYHDNMLVQLDFFHKENAIEHPHTASYFGPDFQVNANNFAASLQTVVVDEKGEVYPISYGFSKNYRIGNIKEVLNGIDIFERYINSTWISLYTLLQQTYDYITDINNDNDLIPWTSLIVKHSHNTLL